MYKLQEKNLNAEMLNGLEYDDPKTIVRVLKMFGVEYDPETKESTDAVSSSES